MALMCHGPSVSIEDSSDSPYSANKKTNLFIHGSTSCGRWRDVSLAMPRKKCLFLFVGIVGGIEIVRVQITRICFVLDFMLPIYANF